MKLYLGIDGGATRSRGALVDEAGEVRATFAGEGLNFYAAREETVRAAFARLLEAAGRQMPEGGVLAAAVVGSAAVLDEATEEETRRLCRGMDLPARIKVVSDCRTALMGAAAGGSGILVVSGTGSVVVGRDGRGNFWRIGGWGHLFGDEGSAYWLGVEALRQAAREVDEGREDRWARVIRTWLGVATFPEILPVIYGPTMDKKRLAGLAQELAEYYGDRDWVQRLFYRAGGELGEQVKRLLALPGFRGGESIPLYTVGGMLEKNVMVGRGLWDALEGRSLVAEEPLAGPHVGAALWARRLEQGEDPR